MKNRISAVLTLSAILAGTTAFANPVLVGEYTVPVTVELKVVKLNVQAKCLAPRFEDDTFTVFYDSASYAEIQKYRGYSSKLLDRTCGSFGNPAELSQTRFETADLVLFNYGDAQSEFSRKVSEAVK